MFSFHKPKVYRSTKGCCICKAKSSSSRFTDSKKYEDDFIECFQLTEPRKGEICNACVLLVKRFKRLPPGSERHWSHVVDARIGPGIKSMTKFKKRKEEQLMQQQQQNGTEFAGQSSSNAQNIRNNAVTERFGKIFKKSKKKKSIVKVPKIDPGSSDENSEPSSPVSTNSDGDDRQTHDSHGLITEDGSRIFMECYSHAHDNDVAHAMNKNQRIVPRMQRKSRRPLKNRNKSMNQKIYLIDSEFWVRIKTCCGTVYENQTFGALLIDTTEVTTKLCPNHGVKLLPKSMKHEEQHQMPIVTTNKPLRLSAAPLPPKKQHTLRQRAMEYEAIAYHTIDDPIQSIAIDYSAATSAKLKCMPDKPLVQAKTKSQPDAVGGSNSRAYNYLHKIKLDSGKIVKKSIDRMTPSKMKVADLNVVKNLVKFCTDKSAVNKKFTNGTANATTKNVNASASNGNERSTLEIISAMQSENKNGTNKAIETLAATNKFSDNSSDSGYEETLHDTAQLNQIAKIGTARPVILSNGIKLHVQPENLLLAANLAGVSQTAIQTTQANLKANLLNQQNQLLHLHQSNQFNATTISTTMTPIAHSTTIKCLPQTSHTNEHLAVGSHGNSISNKNVYVVKQKVLTMVNNN